MKRLVIIVAFVCTLLTVNILAFADGNAYQILTEKLPSQMNVKIATSSVNAQEIYSKECVPLLLKDQKDWGLEGFTKEMLESATLSDPIPVFINVTKAEKGVDGFIQSMDCKNAFQIIVYDQKAPIASFEIMDRGKGYQFQALDGKGTAELLQQAAYPAGKASDMVPCGLRIGTDEFLLQPDDSVFRVAGPVKDGKLSAMKVQELSDLLQASYAYAAAHPGQLGGGFGEYLDTVYAAAKSSPTIQWWWIVLATTCFAAGGLYLIISAARRNRLKNPTDIAGTARK